MGESEGAVEHDAFLGSEPEERRSRFRFLLRDFLVGDQN